MNTALQTKIDKLYAHVEDEGLKARLERIASDQCLRIQQVCEVVRTVLDQLRWAGIVYKLSDLPKYTPFWEYELSVQEQMN